jgi:hypothetical protein
MAGLLVVVLLAFSAGQGMASPLRFETDHHTRQQWAQVTDPAMPTPWTGDCCHDGLACCHNTACSMHLLWASVSPPVLLGAQRLAADYALGLDHRVVCFAPAPAPRPPRSAI